MPRPYPPPPVPSLTGDRGQVELDDRAPTFNIDDSGKRDLARVLGLPNLPQNASDAVAEAIACYKATENGSRDTTVGNTLAALHELEKKGAAYRRAVKRLANVRIPTKPAMHSNTKPATCSNLKPAGIPI